MPLVFAAPLKARNYTGASRVTPLIRNLSPRAVGIYTSHRQPAPVRSPWMTALLRPTRDSIRNRRYLITVGRGPMNKEKKVSILRIFLGLSWILIMGVSIYAAMELGFNLHKRKPERRSG